MSTTNLSNVMEIDDDIHNIPILVNEPNGVLTPNHEQSMIQKVSYTSSGSHYDNHNIISNELKVAINGHSNQAEELLFKKSIISPQPEPSGLDILSRVAQDMLGRRAKLSQRVNQRLITLQPVKVDENISKLTFDDFKQSSDFSKESKAHFVLSIQKYALASSKKNLSKKLQPI
ncbi:2994_t:CDS:2, partial [Funneliformis caledonium]